MIPDESSVPLLSTLVDDGQIVRLRETVLHYKTLPTNLQTLGRLVVFVPWYMVQLSCHEFHTDNYLRSR